jgi:hypothetical protein
MKTSKLKYALIAGLTTIGITAVSIYSCEKEVVTPNAPTASESARLSSELRLTIGDADNSCGEITEKYLLTKEGTKVGKAFIYNDAKNFNVILMTIRGYYMGAASMHITNDPNSFPLNEDKTPAIRDFKYRIDANGLTNIRRFVVPVQDLNAQSYIATSVAVRLLKSGEEKNLNISAEVPANAMRLWIEGKQFGQDGTGRMFKYTLTNCEVSGDGTVADGKGTTELGDDHGVQDPKGVTSLGDGHSTNDPKKPR